MVWVFLIYIFQPKSYFLKDNILEIRYLNLCDDEIESDFDEICTQNLSLDSTLFVNIKPRISKEIYLDKTIKMLQHFNEVIFMKLILYGILRRGC